MNCQVCGAEMAPGAASCQRCGTLAGQAQIQPPGQPRVQPPGQPRVQPPGQPRVQPPGRTPPGDPAQAVGPGQAYGWTPPAGFSPPPADHSLGGLATALTVMLALSAAASLISIGLPVLEVAVILLFLPLIPVFIVWFYQARKNADGRGWRQRWGTGWAIGAWFVPVIFLWFPYQIMADIWRAGLPASERGRPPWLPIAWWACWLLAWITGFRYINTITSTFHGFTAGFYLGETIPSKIFEAAAAILLILVIRAVSNEGVGRPLAPDQPGQPGQPPPAAPAA